MFSCFGTHYSFSRAPGATEPPIQGSRCPRNEALVTKLPEWFCLKDAKKAKPFLVVEKTERKKYALISTFREG